MTKGAVEEEGYINMIACMTASPQQEEEEQQHQPSVGILSLDDVSEILNPFFEAIGRPVSQQQRRQEQNNTAAAGGGGGAATADATVPTANKRKAYHVQLSADAASAVKNSQAGIVLDEAGAMISFGAFEDFLGAPDNSFTDAVWEMETEKSKNNKYAASK